MALFFRVTLLSIICCMLPLPALSAEIAGQKSVMFIGDAFQFVPGAWASYDVLDKAKNERYRMWIATLEKSSKRKDASWMEIAVDMAKAPPVVTRFLVLETPKGPGDLLDVVVQMQGYSPFTVPRKYYTGEAREVGDFASAQTLKRVAERTLRLGDRDIKVVDVEALDPDGNTVTATVSEAVLPIGVVVADANGVAMTLTDWGDAAKSRVEGAPMNFYLWLLKQVGAELFK